jgi:phospholipid-transporting ATPase
MVFKKMSIGRYLYDTTITSQDQVNNKSDKYGEITNTYFENDQLINHMRQEHENHTHIHLFMLCLSLCHSVLNESKSQNRIVYQGCSPDEIALVNTARLLGYKFINKTVDNVVTLEINNKILKYEILKEIEYSSDRKKMSVIVKCPDDRIYLFTKGADSAIEAIIGDNKNFIPTTKEHLRIFALSGLRTLMIAYKELNRDEYIKWNTELNEIQNDPLIDKNVLNELYIRMESDLDLLGSTAIEDELQDDLNDTLNALMQAGIKVWMLTGDKKETAKSIAYSCNLIDDTFLLFEFNENNDYHKLKEDLNYFKSLCRNSIKSSCSMIVNMEELNIILESRELCNTVFYTNLVL